MRAAVVALLALVLAGSAGAATLRPFATGFDQPVYVAAAPGDPGRLYVVEQPGRILTLAGQRKSTFLDIHSLVSCCGERGLLSVAFHPRYAQNRRFFLDYTDTNGDTRVVEYRARTSGAPVRVRQVLFVKQPYPNHNGGQLQFGPDGRLWVGMGDGGSGGDPENRAQNLDERLGKLLRIDVDAAGAPVEVGAYGLRNPWRFSFDGGNLYLGDVGQNAWEEVDFLPGRLLGAKPNFGWSVYEGRVRYQEGQSPTSGGPLIAPVAVYSHSLGCSVTGGYVYHGSAVPAARGRYFYGDYCSGRIWSLAASNGRAVGAPRLEPAKVESLSSWGLDSRGELYAASLGGTIYKLAP
jgi:glucose/arabinose dehydrogenase